MHEVHKHGKAAKHDTHVSVQDSERRDSDRVQFVVSAEVAEISSGARFATRTTDLGPGGCFVDTTVPFPVGTRVQVRLKHAKTSFEAVGSVVYSQTGLGMGISFTGLSDERRDALELWLAQLLGEPSAAHDAPAEPAHEHSHAAKGAASHRGAEHALIVRLLQLLVGKRLLTEAEAASVLHDPVL
jgi:PilZ domain